MKPIAERIRRGTLGVFFASALVLTLACGGGGGGGGTLPPAVAASFTGSGTAAAANGVRLRAQAPSGDMLVLEVAIGGITTSTDLYSFAFDIVLSDPTVATFVAGSDEFGNALTLVGQQQGDAQATLQGNRLVVGVSKVGGGGGNQVPAGESVVVRLTFRVLKAGTTNIGFSSSVRAPEALDSTGTTIPSVQFDTVAAVISGV